MPIAIILLALGAIFIYGGIKGLSITHLLLGNDTVPRTPPNPGTDNPIATGSSIGGGAAGTATTNTQGYTSPLGPSAKFERVDQGVDYIQSTPYLAIGEGVVERIATGWVGGTGQAVYYRLLRPVIVNGRKYSEVYVAEVSPLVKVGDRLKAGQPVGAPGGAEIGFLINGEPTPLVGGLGKDTKPTQAGQDFLDFIRSVVLTQR